MLVIFFATLFAASSAAIIHDGACPEMKPVENFNLTAYQGIWYEIAKFPTPAEKDGKCGTAEYNVVGDIVKLKNTHVINDVQTYIEGTAKLADDANKAAKLVITFKFGDLVRDTTLSVLLTDYSNYAVAYNCKYDDKKKSHEVYAWLLSRTKTLEGEAKTAVDDFLKANTEEFDTSKFVYTDFSEQACKFTSTSVITENPAKP